MGHPGCAWRMLWMTELFGCEEAAGVVFEDGAVFVATVVDDELAKGAVVENVVGDDTVF